MPSLLTPDFGTLFWMLVAFVIVFVILAKYGFPVIVGMVEERKQFIDESLRNARKANEKLSRMQEEGDAILKDAREQQSKILKEAMATRDGIIKEARDKAQEEGNKLLNDAKAQIQAEKALAMQEIRAQVVRLSVDIAGKIVMRDLSENEKQTEYIGKLLDEMDNK